TMTAVKCHSPTPPGLDGFSLPLTNPHGIQSILRGHDGRRLAALDAIGHVTQLVLESARSRAFNDARCAVLFIQAQRLRWARSIKIRRGFLTRDCIRHSD